MPSVADEQRDERDHLIVCMADQRAALRNALRGVSDEQARARPTVSELSLAALLKHAVLGETPWIPVLAGEGGDWTHRDGKSEFTVDESDSLDELLRAHEEGARAMERAVRALPDLGSRVPLPRTPWGPSGLVRPVRWILLHLITEGARHAGHADIIRESLDGATAHGPGRATDA
uniref:DinB family protein n=1 Tax=Streptomyces sp. NBC_01401 TaxID=2903854 RepID=A0AAU3GTE5_9ACTN